MNNENRNEEAVSPVIATILMVAITVVLAGVLYVWASSLAGDSTGSGFDAYTFEDRDATGSMGETTDDKLVHVQLTSGEPLNWATLRVSIVVDGGSTLICGATDGSAAAEGDCAFMTDDSTTWDVAEEITIMENGQDLCDGTNGGCDVDVTLTKIGVGNEDDKVIATVDSFADSSQ